MPTPHTPLRRVSRGSLSALSRSGSYPDAPTSLGFLEPALSDFTDETETLDSNLQGMRELETSLKEFNESFASYLYALKMGAFCTEWYQIPSDESFQLMRERRQGHNSNYSTLSSHLKTAASDGRRYTGPVTGVISANSSDPYPPSSKTNPADRTVVTEATTTSFTFAQDDDRPGGARPSSAAATASSGTTTTKKVVKKKGGKPVLTAKEKKERSIIIESAINALPLEFRGQDPTLRRNTENVIEGLLDDTKRNGVKLVDLIRPDCNQARVNKCLIALVNRKIVNKFSNAGAVVYSWSGPPL